MSPAYEKTYGRLVTTFPRVYVNDQIVRDLATFNRRMLGLCDSVSAIGLMQTAITKQVWAKAYHRKEFETVNFAADETGLILPLCS